MIVSIQAFAHFIPIMGLCRVDLDLTLSRDYHRPGMDVYPPKGSLQS